LVLIGSEDHVKDLPLIIDIKRYAFEDGPGIRSVVFFKGCPLRCVFCHNPEAQKPGPEIAFTKDKCLECGACAEACPMGAVNMDYPQRIRRDKCDACGRCVDACPGGGLTLVGKYYGVETLAEILLRDIEYYRQSGGGVTLSGGEAAMFPDYLEALLKRLKAAGIHVILETSGYFNYETFRRKIHPYLDLISFDVKLASKEAHQRFCGRPNTIILRNLRRIIEAGKVELIPRVPMVPGITAIEENLSAIADLLRSSGAKQMRLLPYNPMGLAKYATLGRPTPDLPARFMTPEEEGLAYEAVEPCSLPRQGWDEEFRAMAERGDDQLLDSPTSTQWDGEEWRW
jgi:pyruvate formate lyase activating enzyme